MVPCRLARRTVAAGGSGLQPGLRGQFGGDPASSAAVPGSPDSAVQGEQDGLLGIRRFDCLTVGRFGELWKRERRPAPSGADPGRTRARPRTAAGTALPGR